MSSSSARRADQSRMAAIAMFALLLAGCAAQPDQSQEPSSPAAEQEAEHAEEAEVAMTDAQIGAAGITLVQPSRNGQGRTIAAPAILEGDPQAVQIVSAPLGGRIVTLTRNLGDTVRRGDTLAIIESREAATLNAEVEAARARAALAGANLRRDETLAEKGWVTRRNLDISRAAAREADVSLKMARQQVSASGYRGGSLNRIVIAAPISGQVIARNAVLGQTFAAEAAGAELFRIANLDSLAVTLSLAPQDAARIRRGDPIAVSGGGRNQAGRVTFVSPVVEERTRLVRVIGKIDNRAGQWRAGEPVQASIRIAAAGGNAVIAVPAEAVQTVENRPVLFIRTSTGFRAMPVELGRRDGQMTIITSGLAGGETIAAANSFIIKAELGKGAAEHGGH